MSINKHIINYEIKLMEMGQREEILQKRETTISIVLKLPSARTTTSLIYPSLEWTRICR
jgi:hypothetical protein